MRRAVLFDLDGVLLNSRAAILATLAGIATASLGRRITVADLPPGAATTPRIEVLTALGVLNPDELCAIWWDPALATAGTALFPGVPEGLMSIKDSGAATGLVTLQARSRLPWLLPPAVLALLDVTICWDDAKPKPAPDGILLALSALGSTPAEAVFVGDTESDIAAAFAAGVTPIGAGWGYAGSAALADAGATVVLDNPAQIGPALLGFAADTATSAYGDDTHTPGNLDSRPTTVGDAAERPLGSACRITL